MGPVLLVLQKNKERMESGSRKARGRHYRQTIPCASFI